MAIIKAKCARCGSQIRSFGGKTTILSSRNKDMILCSNCGQDFDDFLENKRPKGEERVNEETHLFRELSNAV